MGKRRTHNEFVQELKEINKNINNNKHSFGM